jgi:hypothetical protein
MIHSEGYDTSLKILSVCQYLLTLAYGEKSGNTSDGVAYLSLRVEKKGDKRQEKGAEALCVVE